MTTQNDRILEQIAFYLGESTKALRLLAAEVQALHNMVQKLEGAEQIEQREWNALELRLDDLSVPLQESGLALHSAFALSVRCRGTRLTPPDFLHWLTGVDLTQQQALEARREQAITFARWLEPQLEAVSARTRTALLRWLQSVTNGEDYGLISELIIELTPESFVEELRRPGGGNIGIIKQLGPIGIGELQQLFGS